MRVRVRLRVASVGLATLAHGVLGVAGLHHSHHSDLHGLADDSSAARADQHHHHQAVFGGSVAAVDPGHARAVRHRLALLLGRVQQPQARRRQYGRADCARQLRGVLLFGGQCRHGMLQRKVPWNGYTTSTLISPPPLLTCVVVLA